MQAISKLTLTPIMYQCYYMDNNRQKVIVATFSGNAAYYNAVKYCQVNAREYNSALEYEYVN